MMNKVLSALTYIGAVYLGCSPATALAQSPSLPNDRFPQPQPDLPAEEPSPVLTEPAPPGQPTLDTDKPIQVDEIRIIGSTIFSVEDLSDIVRPLEGRRVTLAELQTAANELSRRYQEQGYLTSQAFVPEQTISEGIVIIQVIEGSLQDLIIDGNTRLSDAYFSSRIGLGVDTPLNFQSLEDQLRVLQTNPRVDTVDATLEAGSSLGQSTLKVTIDEANPFYGQLQIDNYSPPSVGSERVGVLLGNQNLTNMGDELSVEYERTFTGGLNSWDIAYRLPVNPLDGTVQLRAAFNDTNVTASPFDEFDIEGDDELYEISWRQPLVKQPREEFALSLAFSHRNGQTFIFDEPTPFGIGPRSDGVTRTSVIRFGQDYVSRDRNGTWSLRSLFSAGTGLLDATSNEGDIPDGQFLSWLGQVQRLQRLSEDHLLVIRGELQFAADSLLISEQFVIGGGESIRGYRQNVRAGDNGLRLSVEDRITLERNQEQQSMLQLIPFFEMGAVWNNDDNPNPQPSQRFLASIGTGLAWQPTEGLNLRLDYGLPLVDLDDRGNNIQDDGFYFSASYRF